VRKLRILKKSIAFLILRLSDNRLFLVPLDLFGEVDHVEIPQAMKVEFTD
jgi:hypothetical protein